VAHESTFIELPVLVAVRAKPIARVVVPFVREANSYPVTLACPELLDQAIVKLLAPLPSEELYDGFSASQELCPIAPDAIWGVGKRDTLRVTRVPSVFCHPNLLAGGLSVERWEWGPGRF
jgi:hypothetical protein